MFKSILEDIKQSFNMGNMLTRLIIINIAVFVFVRLAIAFTGHMYPGIGLDGHPLVSYLAVPSDFSLLIRKPWTIITHMFLHVGTMHILWNMLLLYWFGRIVGDFLGDRRIVPIYIMSGLLGMIFYFLSDNYLPIGSGGNAIAMGASAAVMGFLFSATYLSPDYEMRLILLGSVKLKYIAAVLLFFDIIGTSGTNSGGAFAHLGGVMFGILYIINLRSGVDITEPLQNLIHGKKEKPINPKKKKSPLTLVYHKEKEEVKPKKAPEESPQTKIDMILEKIHKEGIENLTDDEREFLNKAGKGK